MDICEDYKTVSVGELYVLMGPNHNNRYHGRDMATHGRVVYVFVSRKFVNEYPVNILYDIIVSITQAGNKSEQGLVIEVGERILTTS